MKTSKPFGRPTDYDPKMVDSIYEYLKVAVPENMKIPTVEGVALKLHVSKDTLYEWKKIYPDFSDALDELKLRQKEVLTETGIFGGKEINANIVSLLLKVNHNMVETTHTDVTSGGKPLPAPILPNVLPNDGNQETS